MKSGQALNLQSQADARISAISRCLPHEAVLDISNEAVEMLNRTGKLKDRMGSFNDSTNNGLTWARETDGDGAWVRQSATKGYSNE